MERVYADHNATSPVSGKHWKEIAAACEQGDGNPSSIHAEGRRARKALDEARKAVAEIVGGKPSSILFNSGATESNNWVVTSIWKRAHSMGQKLKAVISASEHSSIYNALMDLKQQGLCEIAIAPLLSDGRVDRERFINLIDPSVHLACLIHAQNEVGSINPVEELSLDIHAKSKDCHFHVDSVQGLGKLNLKNYTACPIHSAAFSAHKIGGLKGIGSLYLKEDTPLKPFFFGGGQEFGHRSGTQNMPGIISFGIKAKEISSTPRWIPEAENIHNFLHESFAAIPQAITHSSADGLPTTFNFHIENVSAEQLMLQFDLAGISLSSGSACSSGNPKPSRTLLAMGYDEWAASNSIRASFGKDSTVSDAKAILDVVKQAVNHQHS